MSGLLLFALGFLCGAGLVLALRKGRAVPVTVQQVTILRFVGRVEASRVRAFQTSVEEGVPSLA